MQHKELLNLKVKNTVRCMTFQFTQITFMNKYTTYILLTFHFIVLLLATEIC